MRVANRAIMQSKIMGAARSSTFLFVVCDAIYTRISTIAEVSTIHYNCSDRHSLALNFSRRRAIAVQMCVITVVILLSCDPNAYFET